jgi:hypothetical protein
MSWADAVTEGYFGTKPEPEGEPRQNDPPGDWNETLEEANSDGYWGLNTDPHGIYDMPSGMVYATQLDADFGLRIQDVGTVLEFEAGANLTVPTDDGGVEFPDGALVEVCQLGSTPVTVSAAPGVTLLSPGGTATGGQNATIGLRKREGHEWVLSGALA